MLQDVVKIYWLMGGVILDLCQFLGLEVHLLIQINIIQLPQFVL